MAGQIDNVLNNAERVRRYRERQRVRGLCRSCRNPVADGRIRCSIHLRKEQDDRKLRNRFGLPAPLVRELGLSTRQEKACR